MELASHRGLKQCARVGVGMVQPLLILGTGMVTSVYLNSVMIAGNILPISSHTELSGRS